MVLRVFLLCTAAAAAADLNILSKEEKAAGFRLLFDGKSFRGWRDGGKSWAIEEGCLKSLAKPVLREDLFTQASFGDFELKFDWKISPGGNSGLKYRIQDRFFVDERRLKAGEFKRFEELANESIRTRSTPRSQSTQEYIVGFEYQVIDDSRHKDAQRGRAYQAGALYDMLPAASRAAKDPGQWNEARILVRGRQIEHWLNGVKVVDGRLDAEEAKARAAKRWTTSSLVYSALEKQPKSSSPIALQNHDDEAWFRNLKIRPLR